VRLHGPQPIPHVSLASVTDRREFDIYPKMETSRMRRCAMKRVIGLALAFALTLSTAPAIAEDAFHAFSTIPTAVRSNLAPLPDAQLSTIQGQYLFGYQDVLLPFLNILNGFPALMSLENIRSPESRPVINIQEVTQMQLNAGGASQNRVDIYQQ
jgi:hypothetical protein